MRVLVVDDARTDRLIIGQILRELGMEVVEAGDGREALVQLRNNPGVELVLVDWNMPEMDGIEFIREVRKDQVHAGVRILMVTSQAQCEQVRHALSAGADE